MIELEFQKMEKKLKSDKKNYTYLCKYCGKPCSSFECGCQERLKFQKLWSNTPNRRMKDVQKERLKKLFKS